MYIERVCGNVILIVIRVFVSVGVVGPSQVLPWSMSQCMVLVIVICAVNVATFKSEGGRV